jgi:hypothetical protein
LVRSDRRLAVPSGPFPQQGLGAAGTPAKIGVRGGSTLSKQNPEIGQGVELLAVITFQHPLHNPSSTVKDVPDDFSTSVGTCAAINAATRAG